MFFANEGKPLCAGQAVLTPGTISATLITPIATCSTDVYSIVISTNETAVRAVTISDGTISLQYYVGGGASGANPPVLEQGETPIRMARGQSITASVPAVTTGKQILVALRGLFSST